MFIDLTQLSTPQVYFTMTQTVIPRPVAWILTENDNGSYNLAPFSYFNAVCSDPPLVAVSIGRQPDGSEKDTLHNIRTRSELVIHIASCDQLHDLNQSSATLPPGESEVNASNLPLEAVEGFHLPRLRDCKIAMMCRRERILELGNNHQALMMAQVDTIYLADDCAETNDKGRLKVDAKKIQPLARLGASEYASFGEVLSVKRPA